MPRRIVLSALAMVVAASTAGAADLPTQSRLGRIFAEPADGVGVEVRAVRARDDVGPIIPYSNLPNPVFNRGTYNYGSSWSWYNPGPYYGGPQVSYIFRLPYVCGLYGYCN